MNNPMFHNVAWPAFPIKPPSDIPNFEGKTGEDPGAHITTFHLWCSSNSLNDDSIWLSLFQRTLTNVAAKWYIELLSAAYDRFLDSATMFINHFKLPLWYDVDKNLLLTFRKNKATHISNHI